MMFVLESMATTSTSTFYSTLRGAGALLLFPLLLSISGCCDEAAVPDAMKKLYSGDATVRNKAALQLARCGELAEPAVPRLATMLYDSNVGVQSSSAYALRKIDSPAARAVLERVEAARAARRSKK